PPAGLAPDFRPLVPTRPTGYASPLPRIRCCWASGTGAAESGTSASPSPGESTSATRPTRTIRALAGRASSKDADRRAFAYPVVAGRCLGAAAPRGRDAPYQVEERRPEPVAGLHSTWVFRGQWGGGCVWLAGSRCGRCGPVTCRRRRRCGSSGTVWATGMPRLSCLRGSNRYRSTDPSRVRQTGTAHVGPVSADDGPAPTPEGDEADAGLPQSATGYREAALEGRPATEGHRPQVGQTACA